MINLKIIKVFNYYSPKKCPQRKPVLFGIIQVKRPKSVFFHNIHSNQILINLTFFDDIE